MQPPATPPDEMSRLLALHKLQILDSSPEERFDRITRVAQRVFGVDICLVSLVDTNRQWFKSRQGLDVSETPREVSFCGYAVLDEETFVVDDTLADSRFADNPLVTSDPQIRFYAGQPLHGPQGYRVGTLCVIDRQPRAFPEEDRSTLADLSALVENELNSEPQSIIDEETNIPNRRGFDAVARHLFNLCRRTESEARAIVVGVDVASATTDGQAHATDGQAHAAILKRVSEQLIKAFPSADLVARISDNKFAVLVCADPQAAASGAERLAELKTAVLSQDSDQFSLRVGCTDLDPLKHLTVESLMNEADKRMLED